MTAVVSDHPGFLPGHRRLTQTASARPKCLLAQQNKREEEEEEEEEEDRILKVKTHRKLCTVEQLDLLLIPQQLYSMLLLQKHYLYISLFHI